MSVIATVRYELRLQRRLMRRHHLLNRLVMITASAAIVRAMSDIAGVVHQVLS